MAKRKTWKRLTFVEREVMRLTRNVIAKERQKRYHLQRKLKRAQDIIEALTDFGAKE